MDAATISRHLLLFAILNAFSFSSAFAVVPHYVIEGVTDSVAEPLVPEYRIKSDGSVSLRVCYNWSCARKKVLTFTAEDMAGVGQQMAQCSDKTLYDRLQRIRIGIWQMELLAQKYLPVLANDREINVEDKDLEGRTDCVDNASNSTTYLHILQDISELKTWSVELPQVRDLLRVTDVHWTAVVRDQQNGQLWSVDSWFRPNGHLPFVMPLADWVDEKKGWEPPFDRFNPYPRYINELCKPP